MRGIKRVESNPPQWNPEYPDAVAGLLDLSQQDVAEILDTNQRLVLSGAQSLQEEWPLRSVLEGERLEWTGGILDSGLGVGMLGPADEQLAHRSYSALLLAKSVCEVAVDDIPPLESSIRRAAEVATYLAGIVFSRRDDLIALPPDLTVRQSRSFHKLSQLMQITDEGRTVTTLALSALSAASSNEPKTTTPGQSAQNMKLQTGGTLPVSSLMELRDEAARRWGIRRAA